ncbi:MAG: DUF6515 family protein [Pseudomonadota bacterium]
MKTYALLIGLLVTVFLSADSHAARFEKAARAAEIRHSHGITRDHVRHRPQSYKHRQHRREDRIDHRRDERLERYVKLRVGMRLLSLPPRYVPMTVGATVYYYDDGVYLVKKGSEFVVVSGPIGARVAILPYGFRSFYVGPRRYFFANHTYYVYVAETSKYEVVEAPGDAPKDIADTTLQITPMQGQSAAKLEQDKLDCHQAAITESKFDPLATRHAAESQHIGYNTALGSCLGERGYLTST